ncbi:MAG TPA: hypothetical protein VFX85_02960, partial [Solirubrobacterales bacterium]|nr:hypothetical protein [Solirubrobacterales bacterium]
MKLLLAVALAATTVFLASSVATVQGADGDQAGGGFCSAATSAPTAGASQLPGSVPLVAEPGFSDWFAGGVVNAGAEGLAIMGFNYLVKLTPLNEILPKSPQAKLLAGLDRIEAQLPQISGQLNRVGAKVDLLLARLDEQQLHNQLSALCAVANDQMGAFRRFRLAIAAGTRLGDILAGDKPKRAGQPDPGLGGLSPRKYAENKAADFLNHYDYTGLEGGIDRIRNALLPGTGQISILESYGRVLSAQRFLTRTDSEALQGLYSELANYWALSVWMGAEFWAGKREQAEAVRVLRNYRGHLRGAEAKLPAMIPPGVVVDFGETTGRTLVRRPMWFAPTDKDLGWVPPNDLVNPPLGRLVVDEVGEAVAALNARDALGRGWSAPTQAEVRSLLSKECIADPDEPAEHI